MKRLNGVVLAAALGLVACSAAQFEDKTCVSYDWLSGGLIAGGAFNLGFKEARHQGSESAFLTDLQSKQWDLISLELAVAKVQNKAQMLSLFEQQLAGGAKFIVSYAHLDEWPELQAFLGLDGVVADPPYQSVFPPPPGSPLWWASESGYVANNAIWSDHGDVLEPAAGTIVVGLFKDLTPCMTMTDDRTRLCAGWNFDEYNSATGAPRDMIHVLFGCVADLNRDGALDLSDYLAFVTYFLQGRGLANVNFDDRLDLFDFLCFVNAFNAGCTS